MRDFHDSVAPNDDALPDAPVSLELSLATRVNFASAQNDVAILRSLSLANNGEETLENIEISLRADPAVIRTRTWSIDRLSAGKTLSLSDLHTPLDIPLLSGLNEAEVGELCFTVDGPHGRLAEQRHRLELLARDEWGGLGDMSQILAAFVSPNDAVVASILKEASLLLEKSGHSGAMEGYQSSDPQRVWLIAGAIWSAVTALGLTYANPPASFEREGQKVRAPARIKSEGLATCLDTTLLLAAALEAAGLNPVVLFSQGHAWVGVWLIERDFGYVVEPDVVTVRKASQGFELVPLETTLLTRRPTVGIEQAADEGRKRLEEDREDEFLMAVDISRARAARIRPLAAHVVAEEGEAQHIEAAPAALPKPLDLDLLPGEEVETVPDTPIGRIERWQRKLLDLSLRNRLLNFKQTKQTLPFLCPDVSELEDALADGHRFRAYALTDDDPVGQRQVSPEERKQIEEAASADAFERGQLAVPLTGRDMNHRLLALYRKAKSDMQEGGTNTLFLAAGFLRWKKSETEKRSYKAPLLLIPVKVERRSAQSEFSILHHEDDVSFNATLMEFLKRDFDLRIPELEGELPRDDSGIDVPLILQIMRQKVRDVPGFEVVEELALSTFSFSKYLMWKDLVDRTDDLRKNPLVKHLVDNPTEAFHGNGGEPILPHELDERLHPKEIVTSLPADSSQMAAVVAAGNEQDFVLIGPPGTGKSQTIANIISHCLASEKTVLFVAEKAAALDVVHRRLSSQGLGDAVLELHSNKTDRKTVLSQLGRSWDRATAAGDHEWIQVTEKLRVARDRLNAYVQALHAKGTQGFSVFDAVGWTASASDGLEIAFPSKDAHDEESFRHLTDISGELGRTWDVVRDMKALPLVASTDWSYAWEARFLETADALKLAAENTRRAAGDTSRILGLSPEAKGTLGRRSLLMQFGKSAKAPQRRLDQVPELPTEDLRQNVQVLAAEVKALDTARSRTSATYSDETITKIPVDSLDASWREAVTKFWPFSALAKSKVRKLLQTYADEGTADPGRDLKSLSEMKARLETLAGNPLGEIAGESRDTGLVSDVVEQAIELRNVVTEAKNDIEDTTQLGSAIAELSRGDRGKAREALLGYCEAERGLSDALDAFESAGGRVPDDTDLADLVRSLGVLIEERAHISDWTRWMEAKGQAEAKGLAPLVAKLEVGGDVQDTALAFRRAYARWWLPLALDSHEELRRFAHWDHEDLIEAFRKLDDEAAALAPSEVVRRIQHGLPARDGVPRKSELGTLRHQLGLQRPSMPIRTLIDSMPTTFSKLAPCVLMSPLSIAQYLPAGQAAFDIVIFDEASQITTWDAIGAIARGRQAIVVGDPKQLPPTNFFGRSDDGDEDLAEVERDMPSILDEVCAAGIPTRRLDWHYRSRDEALIAFSNHFYYGGGLVTFPAPATGSEALRFHKIEGTYARGVGRTNHAEAKAIVWMIRERLTEWLSLDEDKRPTLGVITFNIQQQSLILDLLDEARRADPRLEWFFAEEREEPVIVKNLENIQGDERDVMLFSITFAPDMAGKLSMNFGALNAEGGEKRLNVAITRARRELHVFASVTAHQIDLSRTRAQGVSDLKAFLDFAERGPIALPARDEGSLGPAENPFEEAVAEAFRAKGWEVRTQIGVSGFRIDLGVVNPDRAGAFLAGIECDGARYHSSATARDRDKVRQAVLEGLGWNILRVWSTDWFRDPDAVTERLHERLETLLEADRARHVVEETEESGQEEADRLALPAPTDDFTKPEEVAPNLLPPPPTPEPVERPAVFARIQTQSAPGNQADSEALDPERFFEADYTEVIEQLVSRIVANEGPITVARLAREVTHKHGWQRTGRRIAARVEACLRDVEHHDEFGVPFLWAKGSHRARVDFRGLEDRAIRDVSRTEIASVIDQHTATLQRAEDPVLELARKLEITRLSKDARRYLEECSGWWENPEG